MTFLALNGTTIPCLSPGADEDAEEYGLDRARMFDGTMRMTRRGLFRKWTVTTRLLTPSEARTILALIDQGNNLTATGDLVESTDGVLVMPIPGKHTPVMSGAGLKRRLTFVLEEQPTPFLQDTTATLDAFWRGGYGYKTGDWGSFDAGTIQSVLEGLGDANPGEPVSAWLDQTGNGRHWMGGVSSFTGNSHGDTKSPLRDGNELRFGTSHTTNCRILQTTAVHDWWFGLTRAEVMIAFRPLDPAPATDGKNMPWALNRDGGTTSGEKARYPDADGHLYETFASPNVRDLGVSTVDLSGTVVVSVAVDVLATSPNFIERINNAIVFQTTEVTANYPFFDDIFSLTIGGIDSTGPYWDGWIKHMAVFNQPLTDSQRLSWYRFMIGLDSSPPIA